MARNQPTQEIKKQRLTKPKKKKKRYKYHRGQPLSDIDQRVDPVRDPKELSNKQNRSRPQDHFCRRLLPIRPSRAW